MTIGASHDTTFSRAAQRVLEHLSTTSGLGSWAVCRADSHGSHTLVVELVDPNVAGKLVAADAVHVERLSYGLPTSTQPELRLRDGSTQLSDYLGSVALDTVKQIESQLQQRNYEGFLR